jgi:uncharacterized protein (DUF2384 family)
MLTKNALDFSGRKERAAARASAPAAKKVAARSLKRGSRRQDAPTFVELAHEIAAVEVVEYMGKNHIDEFARMVNLAPPMQLLETERKGVDAAFLGDVAKRMGVSVGHLAETIGIAKATAARKLANKEMIDGAAAIALARLLAIANEIVEDSTAPQAKNFDTAKWLGQWIERAQPALGGHKPSELLDTPTGVSMVTKVLGAIRSGAYQ